MTHKCQVALYIIVVASAVTILCLSYVSQREFPYLQNIYIYNGGKVVGHDVEIHRSVGNGKQNGNIGNKDEINKVITKLQSRRNETEIKIESGKQDEPKDETSMLSEHFKITNKYFEVKAHKIFPSKNQSKLIHQMRLARRILNPVYDKLNKIADKFRSETRTKTNIPVTSVINGFEKDYFRKMRNDSQIHTILIREVKEKIFQFLPNQTFDYAANTCDKDFAKDIPGDMIKLYGAECKSLEEASNPKSIPVEKYFNLELHKSFPVTDEDGRITLGFIHVVHNGMVGMDGDVFVSGKKIVPQRCHQNLTTSAPQYSIQEVDEVFTIALDRGWTEYFHSTMEQLPRVAPYLDFLTENKHIKVHVSVARPYLISLLGFLGIPESRTITGTVRARIVYLPNGVRCMHPGFFNIHMLSINLRVLVPDKPRDTIVVIKRSRRRWFRHHDDVIKMVQSEIRGSDVRLEIFDDNNLPSLPETISLFSRAFLVIGPHGAGLSNLLFSEPGTAVIEGTCFIKSLYFHYRHVFLPLALRSYSFYPPNVTLSCNNITAGDLQPAVKFYVKRLYLKN